MKYPKLIQNMPRWNINIKLSPVRYTVESSNLAKVCKPSNEPGPAFDSALDKFRDQTRHVDGTLCSYFETPGDESLSNSTALMHLHPCAKVSVIFYLCIYNTVTLAYSEFPSQRNF